jgi:hypothetical protein
VNRTPQPHQGPPQRSDTFDSHGPDERHRGNSSRLYQRYLTLAQEAARSNDRVASENYARHAEHCFRINKTGGEGKAAAAFDPIDQATVETRLAPAEPRQFMQTRDPESEVRRGSASPQPSPARPHRPTAPAATNGS